MGSKHATAQQGCYSGVAPRAIFTGQHVGVLDFVGVTLNSLLSCEFHHEYTRPTNVAIFLNPTRNGHSSWHGRAVVEWTMLVGWGWGGGGGGGEPCNAGGSGLAQYQIGIGSKYMIECGVIPNSAVLLLFHLLVYSKPPPKSHLLSKICLASTLVWLSQHN